MSADSCHFPFASVCVVSHKDFTLEKVWQVDLCIFNNYSRVASWFVNQQEDTGSSAELH